MKNFQAIALENKKQGKNLIQPEGRDGVLLPKITSYG